ncbi:helix-turn-helix domain-containing protein [Phytohabitans sp. ZYX-F-186]|uniref:Helix-turn-helix domain-containing protein n=1 Tax=Phytohabitans maris TaxID=3071409 RepID=A0ABU0ZND1_9ACTN|nr:helix-turn-helix domain-containing protein [Phytohabitans sp. ZYX-F-186]MDQ7908546.1 helix-turn-helix domain-containing protein [Phytohabitans sp. ZYX-F-186]
MSTDISAWEDRRPRRADARRNYDAIVQAARQAFARHGVGTSIDDIARSAGVGNATLYRHFPTRDDLVVAALAENMAATHHRGLELVQVDPPVAALHEWLHLTVEQISTYGGLPGSLLDSAAHAGSLLGATCTDMQQTTQTLLTRAQRAGQVRDDLTMEEVFDLAAGVAWVASRQGQHRRGARLLDLALTGLAPGA